MEPAPSKRGGSKDREQVAVRVRPPIELSRAAETTEQPSRKQPIAALQSNSQRFNCSGGRSRAIRFDYYYVREAAGSFLASRLMAMPIL